jgi:tetratricopeptide (TPR) repeat protein
LQQAKKAYEEGDVLSAEVLCDRLLAASPREAGALELRARLHYERGRYEQALRRLEPLVARLPKRLDLQRLRAHCLRRAGRQEEAIACYERLLESDRDDAEAIGGLATSLLMTDRGERAGAMTQAQFDAGRGTPAMSVTLVRALLDGGETDRAVRTATEHLELPDLLDTHRRRLWALRGKGLEKLGRFDDAFDAFRRAAEYERVPFDRHAYGAEIDALIDFFTEDWFKACPRSSLTTEAPVFIVGMPRSGSTLIERILDAHPQACAVGEHQAMHEIIETIKADFNLTGPWPQRVIGVTGDELADYGRRYLAEVAEGRAAAAGAQRIIDKALWNTHALGVIAGVFPNCHVIWSRRDPADACVSCFAESFPPHMAPYASDLADLGFVHNETDRLMRHWQRVLPVPVRAVSYEEVIADQQAMTRSMLEAVGLPWHDDCLQFHAKASHADTLSHAQVRRPVYASSIGRASRFAAHIGALRAALAAE